MFRGRLISQDSDIEPRGQVINDILLWGATIGVLQASLAASLKLGDEFNKSWGGAKIDFQDGMNSGLTGDMYAGFIPAFLLAYVLRMSPKRVDLDVKILATAAMTVLTALAGSGIRIGLSEHYKSREGFHPRMSTTTLAIGAGEGATLLAIALIALRHAYDYYQQPKAKTVQQHRRYEHVSTGTGSAKKKPTGGRTSDATLGGASLFGIDEETGQTSPPNSGNSTLVISQGSHVRVATSTGKGNPLQQPLLQSSRSPSPTNTDV